MKPMLTPTPELLAALDEDVRFFSGSRKDERERWILEHWCAITGRNAAKAVKSERPDFKLGFESIEIVEVLRPGRRRHEEFKMTAKAAKGTPPVFEGRVGASREQIVSHAHEWVVKAVCKKQQHYKAMANGWVLLIYLSYEFADRTNFQPIRSSLARLRLQFKSVEALFPDGAKCEILYP